MTGGKGAALLAVLLLGCCACAPNGPPPAPAPASPPAASTPAIGEEPPGGSAGLTYTNLAGEAAAGRVRDILTGAGVPAEAVDTAMDWVADYNRCMAECPAFTLAEDFTTLDGTTVDYGDYPTMSREWYRKNGRDYHDILCRILAFQLDRHSITVEKPVSREAFDCYDSETAWLYTDGDILFGREKTEEHRAYRPFPLLHWEEETVADYFTLFNPVPIQGEPTPEAMLSAVREEWRSRGVSFREGGCTLITFWTEYDGRICASHAAVLAEAGEKLLLFEKTNPESPYSAALFSSAQEVKGYLYDMMALDYRQYDMEVGPFLILQNDQPL